MELAPTARAAYIFSGNATVTLVSKSTGVCFTYRVQQADKSNRPQEAPPHFVRVLTGPDNEADYTFLGTIFEREVWRHGAKSPISPSAESAKAWSWFMRHMEAPAVQVLHSGSCGRCGRKLTTPESIKRGLGPTCAETS